MTVALLTDSDIFPFDAEDRAKLADAGVELRELAGHAPDEVVSAAKGADAVFVYYARFPRETIRELDGVRVLARCGTGYDNIDVNAARERGIEVVYVPDYGMDDIADHALALLFACARRIAESDRAVRAGVWPAYAALAQPRREGTRPRPARPRARPVRCGGLDRPRAALPRVRLRFRARPADRGDAPLRWT
jgi:lactate dehydrogenase-like 2-hydroxyacid dehydrogenase